jgi:transposase
MARSNQSTVGDEAKLVNYESLDIARAIELLAEKDQQLGILLERIKKLEKMIYGPRSTKRAGPIDPALLLPFPGVKDLLERVVERAKAREEEAKARPAQPRQPKPKPTGRRLLSKDAVPNLPRVRNEFELPTSERDCACGGKLGEIREESSQRIELKKLFYVEERVTHYYGCSCCERVVTTTPDKTCDVVEGGMLGMSLIVDLVYQRFGNHTPYNRLAVEFEHRDLPIDRTVIGRNVLRCGELLAPIAAEIQRNVCASFLVQIDDTPVVVRNGKQKGRTTGRLWIYRSPDGNVSFDFRMDRSNAGPTAVLGGYRGFVQGDAYVGHEILFRGNDYERVDLGCWSHVVRKFRDARHSEKRVCAEFDVLFALLHQIEIDVKAMDPTERLLYRSKHAPPVLKEMKDWLDAKSLQLLPKSAMGIAVKYALNNWQALQNYLLDGRITDFTNNAAERALRRVAVGRKNWMHIGAKDAGKPAAVLMSILQTCAEQGVNAIDYLHDVLVQIREPGSNGRIAELTPSGWKTSEAAKSRVLARRAKDADTIRRLELCAAQNIAAPTGV